MTEEERTERYPLRGTVIRYEDPTAPVAEDDWEVLHPAAPAEPSVRNASTMAATHLQRE